MLVNDCMSVHLCVFAPLKYTHAHTCTHTLLITGHYVYMSPQFCLFYTNSQNTDWRDNMSKKVNKYMWNSE